MDLQRIKQSFRIRSGRSKKTKTQTKEQAFLSSPRATDTTQTHPISPRDQFSNQPNLQRQLSAPSAAQKHRRPHTSAYSQKLDDDTTARYRPGRRSSMPGKMGRIDSSSELDFDLRPPAPKERPRSVESLPELLFSAGHLNTILFDPPQLARFTAFLQKYKPDNYPLLMRHLETSKAIAAIEYANALAEAMEPLSDEITKPAAAASVDEVFKRASAAAFRSLVSTALPMFVTFSLVKIVSDCLVNEITGRNTPVMRDLVGGLAEVFCLTDPNQQDNPIIYASEEFYRMTGYDRDEVIGSNCRFLQGPHTKRESLVRIRTAIEKGDTVCETLLNYRRDGRSFINLLMIAPLHDDRGKIKYHIGAQVDVSGLVEGGKALDSFERFLNQRNPSQAEPDPAVVRDSENTNTSTRSKALEKLRDLSRLFDLEESAVVDSQSQTSSLKLDEDTGSVGSANSKTRRKFFLQSELSDDSEEEDEQAVEGNTDDWMLGTRGPRGLSGRLPGIYEKFMLIRPSPSLRIIFTSPKLRLLGNFVQSPFLAHVAAPAATLTGLANSLASGIPVSAKIQFMAERGENRRGTKISLNVRHDDGRYGKGCWISATPLMGSDDRVGVWVVVFVEKLQAKNSLSGRLGKKAFEVVATNDLDDSNPATSKANGFKASSRINSSRPADLGRTNSSAAYQNAAESPVEEYHSDPEHPSERQRIQTDFVQPQTPRYKLTHDDTGRDGKQHKTSPDTSKKIPAARLNIDPDSDIEQPNKRSGYSHSGPQEFPAQDPYMRGNPRPGIHHKENKIGGTGKEDLDNFTTYDSTSTKDLRHDDGRPGTAETIRFESSQEADVESPRFEKANAASKMAPGLSYRDYVQFQTDQGTLHTDSPYESRGRRRYRDGLDDELTDVSCRRSPYSVD